jgi:CHAT domain-containing protein
LSKGRQLFVAGFVALAVIVTASPSRALAQSSGDALFAQGMEAFQRGAFDQATSPWQEAARAYEQDGRTLDRSRALTHLAQAYQSLGQLMKALQTLELALALAQTSNDPAWTASILDSLGRGYLAAGRLEPAGHYFDQALAMARPLARPDLTAIILNDQAILLAVQGQYVEALDAASESSELAAIGGQPSLAVRARINSAWTALRLSRYPDAKARLDQAWDQVRKLDPSHDTSFDLMNLGLAYQELRPQLVEDTESIGHRAEQAFRDADAVAAQLDDVRARSYALGYLGHFYETEQRYPEALELTRRAVLAAQAAGAPESLYLWKWQTGRLLRALGNQDEAIAAYRDAAQTLQPIREELALGPSAAASPGRPSPRALFLELADLLLQRSAAITDTSASAAYLLAARDAIELFKAAEIRDYFGNQCVDQLQARITKLDQVSRTTAVVYPIILPDRTELLVSLPTGLKRIPVPVPAEVLAKEVRAFRRTLEKRTTHEYLPLAQQLYDRLIRPLEPDLAAFRIDTLVFVPDGPLRTIPMAALHDGTQFLIKKYAVATTPGLTLTDPRPLSQARINMLSSGLTQAVQGFPPLPNVSAELRAIRTLYGGDQLVNQEFVIARLERELKEGPFTILHIASHGNFTSDVNDTFLLTFDGKLSMNHLEQLIGLFRYRQDPLELLALSACQTAVGDDRAALGLAGVAIKAGARSAIATLWFINDEASTKLVSEFYRQFHDAPVSKAVALQRAQLKLLEDAVYKHPAYWSPFLLLNNWL